MILRPPLLSASALGDGRKLLHERGHIGLQGVFTRGSISCLAEALSGLVRLPLQGSRPEMEAAVSDYGQGWVFQEQLWRRSAWLADWLLEGPPAQLVCRILQRQDVWLLRDQTYFKWSGSEATPWHQDGTFIPIDGLQSLTLWIPLNPVGADASPMHYLDGSHRACELQPCRDEALDFDQALQRLQTMPRPISKYDRLMPGDCLIHETWCLHGSPVHRQRDARLAFVVVYGYGEGQLVKSHGLNGCGRLLRDQASLLRQANASSCFPGLADEDLVPGLATPMVRVHAGSRTEV